MSSQEGADDLDMSILAGLAADASVSVPTLARDIGTNPSVVYSRIRRLVKNGLIERYTIVINERNLGYTVKALVGINMDSRERDAIIGSLLATNGVGRVAEVTGRFDILVTVYARTLDDMHEIVSERIGKIDGIVSSESFLEMKSVSKDMPHVTAGAA